MLITGKIRTVVNKLYGRHLYLTNTVSCSCLLAIGDVIQQKIERVSSNNEKKYDLTRTGRMFAVGLLLGPMAHYWYAFLDRRFPRTTAKVIGKKILFDQFCAAPTFSFTFITGMNLLEGNSMGTGCSEFKDKFPIIYLVDWLVWPPSQALNFWIIPSRFRASYVYFIDLIWYTFNSYVKHKDVDVDVPSKLNTPEAVVIAT